MMFRLKENGRHFEFGTLDNPPEGFDHTYQLPEDATHWVRVSEYVPGKMPCGGSVFRIARVLKTVAYLWLSDGEAPVKWQISR